ncbi:MAG TPA: metallophosphoesterase, partial [Polyangiaceae bacterium]|nr:metallophosphoesterase [Polyangiaceae bacterium]
MNFSASTQSRVRAFLACGAAGPGSKRARRRGKPGLCLLAAALALGASVDGELAAQTAPPAFVATELVGRPTATSITVNAIFDQTVEVAFDYGTSAEALTETTQAIYPGGYVEAVLRALEPDSEYFYRLRYRAEGGDWTSRPVHRFVTQKAPGSAFVFDVQSDSHQGFAAFHDAALYGVAMENMRADAPDFVVDLGDTFSLDDPVETADTVAAKYLAQRDYLGLFAHSSPVFLVLGNHENEEGWNLDDFGPAGRASSLPVLGANARKTYFLNPLPDGDVYTGNLDASTTEILDDHLKEDYYAFAWGDALFVVLDPFWYTLEKPYVGAQGGERNDETLLGDRWSWTLGKQQYDWLAATLRANERPFVFVFAHHLAGGTVNYSRGGKAGARFGEWGGYDPDGVTYRFDERRPGWDKPVHDLFEETGVSIFFHGHDHVYAMEQHGSVVYQEVPHAANANPGLAGGFGSNAVDYAGAVLRDNSGYLRVRVTAEEARVQYVRSLPPGSEGNGRIDHEYVVLPPVSVPP